MTSTCCSKHVKAWNKYIRKECVKLVINQNTFMIFRSILLRKTNVSDKIVEKIKTHILPSTTFLRKSCRLGDNVKKYSRWQYDACALNVGYLRLQTHTLTIRNTNFSYTATTAARTRLNFALQEHCLSVVILYFENSYSNRLLVENCGSGSVIGISTTYGLDGQGIESRWGARFSAHVQTGPEAHPASWTMGTGSFLGVRCGRSVTLTPHPLLVPRSKRE
jgi:hypothetical protein